MLNFKFILPMDKSQLNEKLISLGYNPIEDYNGVYAIRCVDKSIFNTEKSTAIALRFDSYFYVAAKEISYKEFLQLSCQERQENV